MIVPFHRGDHDRPDFVLQHVSSGNRLDARMRFWRIVNISSINGQKGQFGQTNYAAAKAGILGFTKALALETASEGITVNAVARGYIHRPGGLGAEGCSCPDRSADPHWTPGERARKYLTTAL